MRELAVLGLEFAADVRAGLCRAGQKTLPARWFYDDLGSALFEAITLLPEYGLTRADIRLLERHSREIAVRAFPRDTRARAIELGSGGGKKTRIILEAIANGYPVEYYPIDVSAAALEACDRELGSLANVHPVEAAYGDGIPLAVAQRQPCERVLALCLGSNLGNFEPECAQGLLVELRQSLETADALLLGVDLMKPREQLIAAYDDAGGVTAAFNRNILARINRELDAEFPLHEFVHEVRFDETHARMEMHLRALIDMSVPIGALNTRVRFRAGETIWTESSYKFEPDEIAEMATRSGFRVEACWIDTEWPFAESLWMAA